MLQSIAKEQAAYFKDSFNPKKRLENLIILGSYSLISFDAVSICISTPKTASIACQPIS